jgi:hypothetical protein
MAEIMGRRKISRCLWNKIQREERVVEKYFWSAIGQKFWKFGKPLFT